MKKRSIQTLMIVIVIAIAAAVTIILVEEPSGNLPSPVLIDTKNQPTTGNPDAQVQAVIFEDLKCGNCMRYNTTLFPKIKKQYIDTGKIKYTAITLAFIPGSMTAANAALCVNAQNPKAFFPYVEYTYHHQGDETEDWATIPTMLEFASHIQGIDTNKLSDCLMKSPYTQQVSANLKMASAVMKAQGHVATPTLYLNGIMVRPLTMKQFKIVYNAVN